MTESIYRGYSTVATDGINSELYNMDLVKQDLLNHFNTRIDERVGRPGYGSIIHDLLFDLSDTRTEGLVISDAERIINSDPRVQLLEMTANTDLNAGSITLIIKLRYVEFNMDEQFDVTFVEEI